MASGWGTSDRFARHSGSQSLTPQRAWAMDDRVSPACTTYVCTSLITRRGLGLEAGWGSLAAVASIWDTIVATGSGWAGAESRDSAQEPSPPAAKTAAARVAAARIGLRRRCLPFFPIAFPPVLAAACERPADGENDPDGYYRPPGRVNLSG